MAERKRSVLFVCLGNICRSPMAMAIFQHLTKDWDCDSAALGPWHIGSPPDIRAKKTLEHHGIILTHTARQLTMDDFRKFNFVMGMDQENMSALRKKAPAGTEHKIKMITDFDPERAVCIPDPYYDHGSERFELCYRICKRSIENFLSRHRN